MISASPRPVKPRPTRRLFCASFNCCSSGQCVASSTLSSMRTEVPMTRPKAAKSKLGLLAEGVLTNSVRLIEPRQQQP
jgi:hypothetical protein